MIKIGIICDLDYSRHPCFKNYYYALESLYGHISIVKSVRDLEDIDILFISDDHYYFHRLIWNQHEFIDKCNEDKIKVVVFTTEKIFNSFFPWNTEILKSLQKINELYHYTIDVDDCIVLETKVNRVLMSKHYYNYIPIPKEKIDKIVFIGRTDCLSSSYAERIEVLAKLNEMFPIETIPSDIKTWEEYMQTIAKYRFVLSPIGNGNTFPMRFYEILLVKSIPIHQIRENTFKYYDIEAGYDDCIYFQEPEELPDKIKDFTLLTSHNEFWLEDYIKKLLTEDDLL